MGYIYTGIIQKSQRNSLKTRNISQLIVYIHNDVNKLMEASRKADHTNKRKVTVSGKEGDKKPEGGRNLKKRFKQVMKTPNGLKTAMLLLGDKDKINKALIYSFQSTETPGAKPVPYITDMNALDNYQPLIGSPNVFFPDTSVKLQCILQNNKNDSI